MTIHLSRLYYSSAATGGVVGGNLRLPGLGRAALHPAPRFCGALVTTCFLIALIVFTAVAASFAARLCAVVLSLST